jgi:hypothetical protein
MAKLFLIEGSLRASFFAFLVVILCASSTGASVAQAQEAQSSQYSAHQLELASNPTWMSLLHFDQSRTNITDPNFLLSSPHFSLSAELDATINAFYGPNGGTVLCRFPARYFWLKQYIQLPKLSYELCEGLHEFEQKAPVEKISIVYVSENIAQPSSMMGHLFLKISGSNAQSESVSHAISFYTDAKTFNVPKLIYESTVKGKKGFFTLSPYAEKVNSYVHEEQRNLWELDLELSDNQRRLIQLHLYELKQTEFTYFFQRYNCATVINFIVSLAVPEVRESENLWVTPLDIAKKIKASHRVNNIQVQTSNRWRLRMLQTQLPDQLAQNIKSYVENEHGEFPFAESEEQSFLSVEMAHAYNDYRLEKKYTSFSAWHVTNTKIDQTESLNSHHRIDLSEYKNPLNSPPDSQFLIGVANQSDNWYLRTGILPASHSVEDDNRQYFGETGLHLAALSLLTNMDTGKTRLESFELYAAQSIIPYDKFTGGISGKFSIGVKSVYDKGLVSQQQAFISGALGYTGSLGTDLDVYALAGIGVGFAHKEAYLFSAPEVGLVLREVFDMKSIISVVQYYNYLGESHVLNEIKFTQARYFNKDYAIFLNVKNTLGESEAVSYYDVTLKKYF